MLRYRENPKTSFDTKTGDLTRAGEERPTAPELVTINCTTAYDPSCRFYCESTPARDLYADIRWLQDQLLSLPDLPFEINLRGGEPTAWPDLLDFIKWCRDKDIVVNATVGPSANPDIVQRIIKQDQLNSLGVIIVPGMDKNLQLLHMTKNHAEIPIYANCIIRKDWIGIWKSMAGIFPCYVDGVVFSNFKPNDSTLELVPNAVDIQQLFDTYGKMAFEISFDFCMSCALKHIVSTDRIKECNGGKYSMFIDAVNQEFSQCSFLPGHPFGDIMLNDAWDKMHQIITCPYTIKVGD
jgi:hypothetical protein